MNETRRIELRREKRRELYKELKAQYLNDYWKGVKNEANEVSDTLDYYEESVVRHGEGIDIGYAFLIDELENYGEYGLIESIRKIVEVE